MIWRLSLLCGLLFALAPRLSAFPDDPRKAPDPGAFVVAKVTRGDLVNVLKIDGVLRPEMIANLRARAAGTIEKLLVREGDAVKEGQVLLQLDARGQELALEAAKLQVARARAEVETAESQHHLAKTNYSRLNQLLQKAPGTVGRDEVDQARVQAETARAKVEEAKVGVNLAELSVRKAQLDLEATRLTAPFNGVVLELGANVGELVTPGGERLVVLMSSPERLVFRAVLDARDGQDIRAGGALKVQGTDSKVDRVAPIWRDGDDFPRLAVEARVANPAGALTAFQKATARVPGAKLENVLRIPAAALRWRPLPEEVDPAVREAYREFKYEPSTPSSPGLVTLLVEGKLRPVKVTVLGSNDEVAAVKGPLKEDDTVVLGRKGLE
jgi:RND family efflux transporter MFP subunit